MAVPPPTGPEAPGDEEFDAGGVVSHDCWRRGQILFSVLTGPVDGQHVTLLAMGELCADSAPVLATALDEVIDDLAIAVAVDMSDVSLCTTDGIAEFEQARVRLHAVGGSLDLDRASRAVQRMLDVVGFPAVDPASTTG